MNFLKGTIVTVIILVVLLAINVLCNIKGIHLDTVVTATIAAIGAMLIYGGLTKKKDKTEEKESHK